MALDPFALQIAAVDNLVSSDTNKNGRDVNETPEGIDGDKVDVLDLPMSDEKLLDLRKQWEKEYAGYESKMKPLFERNLKSYLGKDPLNGAWLGNDNPLAANLQFEAEETFLSAALSKNPEPVVWADNTPEGNEVSKSVRTMLQFHSDQLVIRRKLALMVRQWSIYHLGVLKHGWDNKINDVCVENRKIQDFVFDPKGCVDAYGDFTSWMGERITVSAEKLVELFPKHAGYITDVVEEKMGTQVTYTEWWTDEYCFSTFKDIVLEKHKNQYFKYPEPLKDELGQPSIDPITQEPQMSVPRNHFAVPKKPYTFLSVFSLQEQPHDITGLVEQNIANQNRIARQTQQIDENISASNNGYAYSEDNFNQETGKQAAMARRKGNPILIPSGGPIANAILPLPAQQLPADFFNSVEMHKNDLRSSWGIQGIASQQPDEDQTARGMILNQAQDTSRIGGGIGQAIEQVADNVFNYLVQMYYVFYDEPHFAAIMGSAKAVEYVTLSNADLNRQLIVSVAADSMVPKDPITESNLAQALFDKKAIGPKTLLTMLSFPNAEEAAADGVLYAIDPATYFKLNFPEEFAKMQMAQMEQAQLGMQQAAQQKGMETAAVAANTPPEATSEPESDISREPASAALSQVPLPQL